MSADHTYFFLGVDPAPAESSRSDDGALVVLRATPRMPVEEDGLSNNPSHWWRDAVFARRVRKKRSREWAGMIHQLHDRFGFSRICLDPGGGGIFIKRDLSSNTQLINNVDQDKTPIVPMDERGVVVAHFILSIFKRGDTAVDTLWPGLPGDDVLLDAAYASLKDAIDTGELALPPPFHEIKDRIGGWPEERVWALRNLTALQEQLKNVVVATRDDGTFLFTKRNARQFSARGKKDLVSALLFAHTAFLSWLQDPDTDWSPRGDDAGMCAKF